MLRLILFQISLFLTLSATLPARNLIQKKIRLSSEPYISGDTFRSWADHLMESNKPSFNPASVKNGDVIFIKADYVGRFIKSVAPKIKTRYIIITHNSDAASPRQHRSFLNNNNLIAWFAQNVDWRHPKLIAIPIGLANRHWKHGNIDSIVHAEKQMPTKDKLLYMNINKNTHHERNSVYSHFKDKSFCTNGKRASFENYLHEMSQHTFVLSPRGNGLDCHRTWEALLMGCIPIVKTSPLDALLENLPVIIIRNWSEVTEDFLHKQYKELLAQPKALDQAYAAYWKSLIMQLKKS